LYSLWDAATGVLARRLPASSPGAVGFSPDGAVLTAGGLDGVVRSWEVTSGRLRRAERVADPVGQVAVAPGHAAIATTHGDPAGSDTAYGTNVKLWDGRPDRP
jgi:WD40 repeat protein